MTIKSSDTIIKTLDHIHRGDYVLPSIQREFVWGPDRIVSLFDSLMREYPIGTFLFWRIDPDRSADYAYYGFIRDYHQRTSAHCPSVNPQHGRELVAILDGQQRLTSLNIGIAGTHAVKLPNKRRANLSAYPVKRLYLDLLYTPGEDDDFEHRFEFMTDEDAAGHNSESGRFFLVPELLEPKWRVEDADELADLYVEDHVQGDRKMASLARRRLMKLWRVIHKVPAISYFEETDQQLDRVLDIFIRVNSGGMTLSKSDLLMSIATAQWSGDPDARTVIYNLVDDLNQTREGFNFNKDMILKTGLVEADIPDVGFKVQNFTADNMAKLEAGWDKIERSLRVGVDLVASFGFNARTLSATSSLIPIADYIHMRGFDESFVTAAAHADDRDNIRDWLTRSLLKHGVWGSGLDSTLRDIRGAIRADGAEGFPVTSIETAMRKRGKVLSFDAEEVDALLDTKYGTPRAFMLLALLYPGIDLRDQFHVDHIYPRVWFTTARLRKAGISEEQIPEYEDARDRIANLQLLRGSDNTRKREMSPTDWFEQEYPDEAARADVLRANYIASTPGFADFLDFFESRREELRSKLIGILHASDPSPVA